MDGRAVSTGLREISQCPEKAPNVESLIVL